MKWKHGRKILVVADTKFNLACLLRMLADDVEEGIDYKNVEGAGGARLMRPLRDDEENVYMDVRKLP